MLLFFLFAAVCGYILLHLLDLVFPPPAQNLLRPAATEFLYSDGRTAGIYLAPDDKVRLPLKTGEIPKIIKQAFIASEDRFFYLHSGINPVSLLKAAFNNLRRGRIVSGASTISMQVARMAEPRPRRLGNKLIEAFRSWQLEKRLTKDEILTVYLNLLPFGGNIEGVEAASRLYFNKKTRDLHPGEIAILTVIPRAPQLFNPVSGRRDLLEKARRRSIQLLRRNRVITPEMQELAEITELPERRLPLPREIPHLTDYLYHQLKLRGSIRTTISRSRQSILESIGRDYARELQRVGIKNLSVVVIDNREKSLLAALGSENYDHPGHGQVIGFNARRSPGSLLKPFLYALALQHALITPLTLLEDTPIYFREYEPTNFGGVYSGISSAKDALCDSLNIPALNLLEKVGLDDYFQILTELGFSIPGRAGDYGLSLVLGAAGVTLLEAAEAFCTFSNYGRRETIRLFAGQQENLRLRQVMPAEVVFILNSMLQNHGNSSLDDHQPFQIAWKTGTSFNFRDAWAIGYNTELTVAVWTGSFSGPASSLNTGHRAAAPLMFRIMEQLGKDRNPRDFSRPEGVREITVCSLSGMLPNEHCPQTRKTIVPADRVPMERCSYHKLFPLDNQDRLLCRDLILEPGVRWKTFIDYPPGVRSWLALRGRDLPRLPDYHPDCRPATSSPPRIIFPLSGQVFDLAPSDGLLTLKTVFSPGARDFFLFVNGRFQQRFPAGPQIVFFPPSGRINFYLVDELGQAGNTVSITVK